MKKLNTILAAIAVGLILISALAYRNSVTRAERFERGQDFLPNLNPDEIAEIAVTKGEETTRLRREGDRFVLLGAAGGYPADTAAVNRLIKDVLELSLEKEVGTGEGLDQELGLVAGGEDTVEVAFSDGAGKEMVRFLVGKASEGESGGNYVRRVDGEPKPIYLTSSRVYFTTGADELLDKQIVAVPADQLQAVVGDGFRIAEQDGALHLADLPAGKKESANVSQLTGALASLRFTDHHLADAPAVRGVSFDRQVTFELKDGSGYHVVTGELGGKHYLRIEAFHTTGQIEITVDAAEEEVRQKSEILVRADEVEDFNALHGSWIYEVTEPVAEKLRFAAADLVENA